MRLGVHYKMKKYRKLIQFAFLLIFFFIISKGNMFIWLGLFLISLIGATIFGRFYCGYICPMNTVMGATGILSKKLNCRTKSVPKVLRSKYLPWIVLLLMIGTMVLSKKVFHQEVPILILLMAVSILVTLRYEEWVFHNHICPYGALLSLTGRWAKFSTKVEPNLCIGCKKCETVCPSKAISVNSETKVAQIDPSTCHQCQACTLVCPKNAILYTGRLK